VSVQDKAATPSITSFFNKWRNSNPFRESWEEDKKLRAAFNAGVHTGRILEQHEGLPTTEAKTAFRRGLNAAIKKRRLTFRGPSDTLSSMYHLLTIMDREENHKTGDYINNTFRRGVAEAINRIKLSAVLLLFLDEKKMVEDFKQWYFTAVDEPAPEPALPTFNRD
jgi:hypothetical protein